MENTFSWQELMTDDFEQSLSFYKELFGWTLQEVPGRNSVRYALISTKENPKPFAGIIEMPEMLRERKVPSHWNSYVTSKDIESTFASALKLGAQIVVPIMEIPRIGKIASFKDITGATISVIEYV